MKVLLADDDPGVRALIGEYLTRRGMEIIEAANGLETLLQVKRERPDALVLDLLMPRLGGLEALKRIRAFDPAIVVVVVTGYSSDAVEREAAALGARAVLSKPVALTDLVTALGGGPAAPAAATVSLPASPAPEVVVPTRVLVVDDDTDVRGFLVEFVRTCGYETVEAENAETAIRILDTTRADVILLDITMPGLSGADALPRIRAVAPNAAVIMVSGIADSEVARRTLAHGAFDFVVKPVDLGHLARSIEFAITMRALGGSNPG